MGETKGMGWIHEIFYRENQWEVRVEEIKIKNILRNLQSFFNIVFIK